MSNLRVAIIGLGMMGTNHARVLSNLEGVELVAVADPQGDTQRVLPNFKVLKSVDEVIQGSSKSENTEGRPCNSGHRLVNLLGKSVVEQ